MISRLINNSSRLSFTTTIRFLQFSSRNSTRFGGNRSGSFNIVHKICYGVRNVGRTIKGRLLAPSSEKPLIIGAAAVAATAVYGIGSLVYYSLVTQKDSILQHSDSWSDAVRRNISNTYAYFFGSLGITTASAIAVARSPAFMRIANTKSLRFTFATMIVFIVAEIICIEIPYNNTAAKHAAWVANCAILGGFMAPLCVLGGPVLIRAAWYTAGIVGGLSATAILAPSEKYLKWFAPLSMAFGVVFMANVGAVFLPKIPPQSVLGTNLISIVFFGGLVLFSLLLLHDTQRLVKEAVDHEKRSKTKKGEFRPFDPINEQIPIFLDAMNIFIRLATFGSRS